LALPGLRGAEASSALEFKDALAEELPREDVEKAQELAKQCRDSGFKTCD